MLAGMNAPTLHSPGGAANASHRGLVLGLAAVFAAVFAWSAWRPLFPRDWWLENVLNLPVIAILTAVYRWVPLTRAHWVLIGLFMCLHETGAHYTYAEVPYNDWTRAWFGRSLNEIFGWERNHFDRFVHFSYGLFIALPIRQLFLRVVEARGFWSYFLPLDLTLSSSALYELIEWGAAETVGGDLGMAYLGTQGDVWDAHRDMALAGGGALIAILFSALLAGWRGWKTRRDLRLRRCEAPESAER